MICFSMVLLIFFYINFKYFMFILFVFQKQLICSYGKSNYTNLATRRHVTEAVRNVKTNGAFNFIWNFLNIKFKISISVGIFLIQSHNTFALEICLYITYCGQLDFQNCFMILLFCTVWQCLRCMQFYVCSFMQKIIFLNSHI